MIAILLLVEPYDGRLPLTLCPLGLKLQASPGMFANLHGPIQTRVYSQQISPISCCHGFRSWECGDIAGNRNSIERPSLLQGATAAHETSLMSTDGDHDCTVESAFEIDTRNKRRIDTDTATATMTTTTTPAPEP